MRVPGHKISRFDIDTHMQKVALATSGGSLLLYDLAKALENESLITKKRLDMSVNAATMLTYLTLVSPEEFDREMSELNLNNLSLVSRGPKSV